MLSLRRLSLLLLLLLPMSFAWGQADGSITATAESITNVAAKVAPGIPAMTVTNNASGGQDYTVTIQILAIMTVLTLLPSVLMMMTAFTRVIIVFAILGF